MDQHSTITVRRTPGRHRYELLDAQTVIGTAHYQDYDDAAGPQRIFLHTTVEDDYTGQGLGGRLTGFALDDTVAEGLPLVTVCTDFAASVEEHPEYPRHTVLVLRDHLAALQSGDH
ncbi:GNAT family N-acetyltransferase [Kocuria sp. M1N1S27]|uniref:GNAT family N-acetyltransferase n=1 Tax=Kocuria kalidii TaxID=3376283 RepID=UPI0037B40D2A